MLLVPVSVLAPLPANDVAEVVIPLVAIIGGLAVPIVALILAYRKQQLQARIIERAIEQGLTVEEIDSLLARQGFSEESAKERATQRAVPFRRGLVLFAVGVAFFLVANPRLVGLYEGPGSGWFGSSELNSMSNFVAYLLIGIGAALVVADLLAFLLGRPDSAGKD